MKNVEGVETHQLLAGLFSIVRANVGHGLERATESPPGSRRCFGYTLDLSVVPGEEGDDLVGFMDGPRAEDNGFDLVRNHGPATGPTGAPRQTNLSARER